MGRASQADPKHCTVDPARARPSLHCTWAKLVLCLGLHPDPTDQHAQRRARPGTAWQRGGQAQAWQGGGQARVRPSAEAERGGEERPPAAAAWRREEMGGGRRLRCFLCALRPESHELTQHDPIT